jgi:predicted nuclease of predicted toxin-antitoxin system
LRFIIDHMFPKGLAEFFISKGHEASTARRLGMKGGSDEAIWQHAEETGSVVVSHDSDFVAMAAKSERASLVHYRGGNKTTADLINIFDQHLPAIVAALESGERYVEFG